MPVLGISVALAAAFVFGAGLVRFCMNHTINQALSENDDLRHANSRLINEIRDAYQARMCRRAERNL